MFYVSYISIKIDICTVFGKLNTKVLRNKHIYIYIYIYIYICTHSKKTFCYMINFRISNQQVYFLNLFLAVLGLYCCIELSLVAASGSYSLVVVVHGLSCPVACGSSLDQGSIPYLLHWWVDSQPVDHQGSPINRFKIRI